MRQGNLSKWVGGNTVSERLPILTQHMALAGGRPTYMTFEGCWEMTCMWYLMLEVQHGRRHVLVCTRPWTHQHVCRHQHWAVCMWGVTFVLPPGTGPTKPEAISSAQLQKQGRHCVGKFSRTLERRRRSGLEVKEQPYWYLYG